MLSFLPCETVDPRVRRTVMPVAVTYTAGDVENPGHLLDTPAPAISLLREQPFTRLRNGVGERATLLLDFGRELHGGIRCVTHWDPDSTSGASVLLRFGESVGEALSPISEKNATNDHAAREFTVTLPQLSDVAWGETGFRYVSLTLLPDNAACTLLSVTAEFIYRDIPYRGSFHTSDALLDKIYETAAYTLHLCMQKNLWDGVKRDRLLWVGDMYPEIVGIRTVFGRQAIVDNDLRTATELYPLPAYMNTMPAYSLWYLMIVSEWYDYTGDAAFARQHRDYVTGLLSRLLPLVGENGEIALPSYFLDWQTEGDAPAVMDGDHALAAMALSRAAALCRLYGDTALASMSDAAAKKIREHYRESGTYRTSPVSLLTLAGMLSESDAAQRLSDARLSTFFGYFTLRAIAATRGMIPALQAMRQYYGAMLDLGATTFFEDFSLDWLKTPVAPLTRRARDGEKDIHGDFGAHCYKGYRHSLCHGWSAGVTAFCAENILGVRFASPGGKEVTISPDLGDLSYAEGKVPLPDGGEIFVRAEKATDGTTHITYTAPDGVSVTVGSGVTAL